MRKKKASSGERDDVPLLDKRSNLFEHDTSNVQVRKKASDRLPFKRKPKPEVKYGPNRTIYFNDAERNAAEGEELKYSSNIIKTSTYTLWSFLPLNLFEQFKKVANFYFLVIVILMLIPGLSPIQPFGTMAALAFVVGVSALRSGYEDIKRHRDDRQVNNTPANVLKNGDFAEAIPWRDLKVGDVVRVEGDHYFPADLLLINSSEPNGMVFVNTMNLDGETNTKPKQAPSTLHNCHAPMEIASLAGYVKSEGPNKNLDAYTGTLVLEGQPDTALDNKNIVYRGCQLVTAKYCYGIVLFTGKQTKLMKNNIKTRVKKTKLDKMLNNSLVLVLIMLGLVCLIGAIGMGVEVSDNFNHSYLAWTQGAFASGALNFFTYLILFSGMVPISLYVSVEMVKVIQALLIDQDLEMYDEKSDTPAKAKTSALSEELGQISYIFSDKTGTLTRNEMEFKKCCINGKTYGKLEDESKGMAPLSTSENPEFGFRDAEIEKDISGGASAELLNDFWTTLSVCHTVLVEVENGQYFYNAESPDEAALVEAAAQFGWRFVERVTTSEGSFMTVLDKRRDQTLKFQLLNILEFNSTRKRMSVVVREMFGAKRILLMCKGADNIIKERLEAGQESIMSETDVYLNEYAQIGLRTLLISHRVLSEDWYNAWQERFHAASTAVVNREDEVAAVAVEMEQQLRLLGATAIEDKLQEGVPEAIANLAESGIKIWVLTGDKKDTAINIGFSCRLLQPWYRLIVIDAADWHETQLQMKDALERYVRSNLAAEQTYALVIEGQTLHHALEPENRLHLLELATSCKAVICCRVSPKQKAEVVELVKKSLGKACLSIGDGANDVSMIREAHIGVGISGHEGRQAVMAADYAIAQFRFLEPLLLVHGRYSYKRITMLIKFSFYKNYVFGLVQIWFGLFNKFSGQTMFDTWMLTFYNLLFTSLPIMFFAVLDRDVDKKVVRALPQLYETGLEEHEFNLVQFVAWVGRGIVESLIVFFVCYLVFAEDVIHATGHNAGLWSMGVCAFTGVLVAVSGKLALYVNNWTIWMVLIMIVSLLFWFGFILAFSYLAIFAADRSLYMVGIDAMSQPTFWLGVGLIFFLSFTSELLWMTFRRWFYPENYQIAQYLQHDTRRIAKLVKKQKKLPPRLLKNTTVLEMAKSLEGLDPATDYHGFAYSGTEGGRNTLVMATGAQSKATF